MFRPVAPPDSSEFAGRRVVVTGGSRGIGAAIARRLLDGGATVVVTARSQADTPSGAIFIPGDISSIDGVTRFTSAALEALGGIDILINNAGAARAHPGGIATIPDQEWLDALELNYLSAVRVTNALLPRMLQAEGARAIVNISSKAAATTPPPLAHYGAAKAALNAYSRALSKELAPAGIRVIAISPGTVTSPGADAIRQEVADAQGLPLDAVTPSIPLGRLGDPQDIAEAVAYLASERAQWITGINLTIDGGN
ncbi:oxidoreductase [Amnibacterium setariae]|uniref:SDR family oxidoreductase n=1 Tax=Amnibacterium setariae TaxID=2306585 RepID=A0A3A1TYH1_9MICO|nr:oxidoreductase [Amnibacterium setariae]RIX28638.1 SDR family oxidoreductase [Amnibacterium setariae]